MNHFGNIINCPNYKNNKLNTNWSEFNKHKNHMNYGLNWVCALKI